LGVKFAISPANLVKINCRAAFGYGVFTPYADYNNCRMVASDGRLVGVTGSVPGIEYWFVGRAVGLSAFSESKARLNAKVGRELR
jgi:hypothetical protein